MRAHYLYENGGIYVDTDMEIIKDITPLLNHSFFTGYEDDTHVSVGIFGTEPKSPFLKDVMEFYEEDIWELPIWTIPKIFTYILEKKYGLTEKRENTLKGDIVIYPREYFYPYHFTEKYSDECIKANTYGIHWWNDSWSSLKAKLFLESKHLKGIKKLIKKIRIVLRYYIKKYYMENILSDLIQQSEEMYDELHKNSNILNEILNIECINYNITENDIILIKINFIENIKIFSQFLNNLSFSEIDEYIFEQLIDILKDLKRIYPNTTNCNLVNLIIDEIRY